MDNSSMPLLPGERWVVCKRQSHMAVIHRTVPLFISASPQSRHDGAVPTAIPSLEMETCPKDNLGN